jgi:hypothetical protein
LRKWEAAVVPVAVPVVPVVPVPVPELVPEVEVEVVPEGVDEVGPVIATVETVSILAVSLFWAFLLGTMIANQTITKMMPRTRSTAKIIRKMQRGLLAAHRPASFTERGTLGASGRSI